MNGKGDEVNIIFHCKGVWQNTDEDVENANLYDVITITFQDVLTYLFHQVAPYHDDRIITSFAVVEQALIRRATPRQEEIRLEGQTKICLSLEIRPPSRKR